MAEGRGYGCEAAFDGFIKVCLCAKAVHSRSCFSRKHKVSFSKYYYNMLDMTISNFDYIKEKFSKEIVVKWTARKVLILKQKYFFLGFKKSLKKYLQFYEFFQKVNIIAICVSNVWVSFWAWNMYLRQGRCLLKIWEKENQK